MIIIKKMKIKGIRAARYLCDDGQEYTVRELSRICGYARPGNFYCKMLSLGMTHPHLLDRVKNINMTRGNAAWQQLTLEEEAQK